MSCAFGCDAAADKCATECTSNAQCSTGICKPNGDCAAESEIAYTSPAGSPSSDCSRFRALHHRTRACTPQPRGRSTCFSPPEPIRSKRVFPYWEPDTSWAPARPRPRSRPRPWGRCSTLEVAATSRLTASRSVAREERCQIRMTARRSAFRRTPQGRVPRTCSTPCSRITAMARGKEGLLVRNRPVELRRVLFDGNYDGAHLESSTTTVDRCSFVSNVNTGLVVSQAYSVTNSFFARSQEGLRSFQRSKPVGSCVQHGG